MRHFFDIDTKPYRLEQPVGGVGDIEKGLRSDNRARWLVGNPQHEVTAAFVCDRHAIIVELVAVEAVLRLFEFESLMLGGRLSPKIDLRGRGRHGAFANSGSAARTSFQAATSAR